MTVIAACPNCQKEFKVAKEHLGRKARCKGCGGIFRVSSTADRPEAQAQASPVPVPGASSEDETDVPFEWAEGDVILDLYQVKRVHSGGGMGLVYRVRHRGWGIDLAVKCPRKDYFKTQNQKENFVRECHTWMELGLHPNTVSCYYVRTLGGVPRVFAEYVEGGSLSDWLHTGKLYEGGHSEAQKRILDIAIQFAWGLQYAHEKGLVHQDVKPANVLMAADGVAKVTDFGLAKARAVAGESALTDRGQSLLVSSGGMTPAYCSPEQANRQPLSRKTDIWSWGLSVLEMFTGEVTWMAGQVASEALEGYLEMGAEDESIPKMPEPLADLLRRCFQRNPDDRPKDFAEIAEDIETIYAQAAGQAYARQAPKAVEALADSLNNRAISMLDLAKPQEAEALFEQALQADPHHLEATYNRGVLLWRTGRIDDVTLVRQLESLRMTHENSWRNEYLLGLIHVERADADSAIAVLEKAARLSDHDARVIHALEKAKGEGKGWSRLVRAFQAFTFRGPNSHHGHDRGVSSLSLSPDGRYALSGSRHSHNLNLWNVDSGECIQTLIGHTAPINAVCLSTDVHYALSAGGLVEDRDKTLRFWDVATAQCLRTINGRKSVFETACLSSDSRLALSGNNRGALELWDLQTGECLRAMTGHQAEITSVCFSNDDRYALSGSGDKTVKLWDLSNGNCLQTLTGHSGGVTSVCLSGDGRYAVSAANDWTLTSWDLTTGRCLRTFTGHRAQVLSIALSADGRHVLSGSADKTVKLWDMSTGRCWRTFEGHKEAVTAVCLSADGRLALSGIGKGSPLELQEGDFMPAVWQIRHDRADELPWEVNRPASSQETSTVERRFENCVREAERALSTRDAVGARELLKQARALPGCQRRKEFLDAWSRLYCVLPKRRFRGSWESATFEGHSERVTSACLSTDNCYALSGSWDRTLKLWDVTSGECLRTFEGHTFHVTSVCFSEDSHYALSASSDKTLKMWDVAKGECVRTFEGHTTSVNSVCLSPDGRHMLSGSDDQTLRLWNIATGECLSVLEGHRHVVKSVALAGDGTHALSGSCGSYGKDETQKLWDLSTGRCLQDFRGHMHDVNSVCLSGDGRFALTGADDHFLKHWDVSNGTCVRTFEGHTGFVTAVHVSADDRYALSGGSDDMMKLWDVFSGECLQTFHGHTGVVSSVFLSRDSRYALSASWDKTLRLWELDWELEPKDWNDWDDSAELHLRNFLIRHQPVSRHNPLVRQGQPRWTEDDLQKLITQLQCAGYGWLRPEGVRKKLEETAANWQDPPPLPGQGT